MFDSIRDAEVLGIVVPNLTDAIKAILNFPTYRHAREFFDVGTRALRQDGNWPPGFFQGSTGTVYSIEEKDLRYQLRVQYQHLLHFFDQVDASIVRTRTQGNHSVQDTPLSITVFRHRMAHRERLERRGGARNPTELVEALENFLVLDVSELTVVKDGKQTTYQF